MPPKVKRKYLSVSLFFKILGELALKKLAATYQRTQCANSVLTPMCSFFLLLSSLCSISPKETLQNVKKQNSNIYEINESANKALVFSELS